MSELRSGCYDLIRAFDDWCQVDGGDNNEWDAVPAAVEEIRALLESEEHQ